MILINLLNFEIQIKNNRGDFASVSRAHQLDVEQFT